MFDRVRFKEEAKLRLNTNWSYMAGLNVIILILTFILGLLNFVPILGFLVSLIVSPCFVYSKIGMAAKLYHRKDVEVSDIFSGFHYLLKCAGLSLWISLWVFLWSLLFIIPGIVKSYSYSMAFYCLYENPTLTIREALKESIRITDGYKGNLFVMDLSFIGWEILTVFTCGIGILFLSPYMVQTQYNAFRFLRGTANPQEEQHEEFEYA